MASHTFPVCNLREAAESATANINTPPTMLSDSGSIRDINVIAMMDEQIVLIQSLNPLLLMNSGKYPKEMRAPVNNGNKIWYACNRDN